MKIIYRILTLSLLLTHPSLFAGEPDDSFTKSFNVKKNDFSSTGSNPYFILEPGFKWVYHGEEDGKKVVLKIKVLDQTKMVDGVETRVVEEKELVDGNVIEISQNYFAISKKTKDVFYFGEAVDIHKNGEIVHEGAWLAGEKGAQFGLIMPAKPIISSRYYQEFAPKQAMDRAEVISLNETVKTPAGKFKNCLKIKETSALEKGKEFKLYAPNIGLVQDDKLKLVKYGKNTL